MVAIMRVDVMPLRQFIIVSAIALGVCVLGLIMGAVAPPSQMEKETWAYDCPKDQHFWNASCHGVQLALGQTLTLEYNVTSENSNLGLIMVPMRLEPVPDTELTPILSCHMSVAFYDSNNMIWDVYETTIANFDFACQPGEAYCSGTYVWTQQVLATGKYRFTIKLNNTADWMGDVRFVTVEGNKDFSAMVIGVRIVYFLLCIAGNVVFILRLRREKFESWTWEQRTLAMLLLFSVFLDNPFLPLRYAWDGWFFFFVDSLLEATWMAIAVLYWLFMIDKIRLEETRLALSWHHAPKLVAVFVYTVLVIVFFTWVSLSQEENPLSGGEMSTGITVLFYIVVTYFMVLIIWICILAALALPAATAKSHQTTRFLYFAIPTAFVIVSIVVGMLTGTYGPQGREGTQFVYYSTMWNVYLAYFIYGYWPLNERFSGRNAVASDQESSPFAQPPEDSAADTALLSKQ